MKELELSRETRLFQRRLQEEQIFLSDTQMRQFIQYYVVLIYWNQHIALTGITEYS